MSLIYFPHRLARLLEKLNFQRQQAIFKGINISFNWTMDHGCQPLTRYLHTGKTHFITEWNHLEWLADKLNPEFHFQAAVSTQCLVARGLWWLLAAISRECLFLSRQHSLHYFVQSPYWSPPICEVDNFPASKSGKGSPFLKCVVSIWALPKYL